MKIPSTKFFTQKTSGPKALVCFDTHKNNASGRRHTTRDAHTHGRWWVRHLASLDLLRRVVRGPETLATEHRRRIRHRVRRLRVRLQRLEEAGKATDISTPQDSQPKLGAGRDVREEMKDEKTTTTTTEREKERRERTGEQGSIASRKEGQIINLSLLKREGLRERRIVGVCIKV